MNRRYFLSQSVRWGVGACLAPLVLDGCGKNASLNSNTEHEQPRLEINYTSEDNFTFISSNGQTTSSLDELPKLLEDSLRDVDIETVKEYLVALNIETPSVEGNKAPKIIDTIVNLPDGLQFRYDLLPHYHPLCKPINENRDVEHYNFALHQPTTNLSKGHDLINLHVAWWEDISDLFCGALYLTGLTEILSTVLSRIPPEFNPFTTPIYHKDGTLRGICIKFPCWNNPFSREFQLTKEKAKLIDVIEEAKAVEAVETVRAVETVAVYWDVIKWILIAIAIVVFAIKLAPYAAVLLLYTRVFLFSAAAFKMLK